MRLIVLIAVLCSTFSLLAQAILPKLAEENLVTDEESKLLYFKSLRLDLVNQGYSSCNNGENKWLLVDSILENGIPSQLYKFTGSSPLFVIRVNDVDFNNVNIIDFKFFTNANTKKIVNVEVTNYSQEDEVEVNVGSHSEPVFEFQQPVKVLFKGSCY